MRQQQRAARPLAGEKLLDRREQHAFQREQHRAGPDERVQPKKRRRAWIVALVPTAVAAAVALAVVLVKPNVSTVGSQTAQEAPVATQTTTQPDAAQAAVDKAFAQLSTADQQYIIDMYEASERMSADYYYE